MASTPLLPLGSKLQRKNPTSSVFEDVPQVISMGFPGATQQYADISNMDSPAGFAERVATIKEPRDMPVEILYNPADSMHNTIFDDAGQNPVPLRTWKILFPGGTRGFQFDAFPGSPDGSLTVRDAARVTFTLGVSGEILRLAP